MIRSVPETGGTRIISNLLQVRDQFVNSWMGSVDSEVDITPSTSAFGFSRNEQVKDFAGGVFKSAGDEAAFAEDDRWTRFGGLQSRPVSDAEFVKLPPDPTAGVSRSRFVPRHRFRIGVGKFH